MDAYTGEIRIFCGTFAPMDWAYCNGSLLNISVYSQLYAVIGTSYGGNGSTTFALPNLNGVIPVGMGQGTGLSNYNIAGTGGSASYTLNASTLPPHSHAVNASGDTATLLTPQANLTSMVPAGKGKLNKYAAVADTLLNSTAVGSTGSTSPTAVSNVQSFLAVNFIICVNGYFPVKP